MIGPERNEPLDERAFGHDAFGEGGSALGGGNPDQAPAGFLPRCALLLGVVALRRRCPKDANRVGNRLGRALRGRPQHRRLAFELRAQPAARIAHAAAFAGPGAEAKTIEGAKRGVHLLNYRTELARVPLAPEWFCHRFFIDSTPTRKVRA